MAVAELPGFSNDDDESQRDADLSGLIAEHREGRDEDTPFDLPELTVPDRDPVESLDLDHDAHPTPELSDLRHQEFLGPGDLPELDGLAPSTPDPTDEQGPQFGEPEKPETPTPFAFMPDSPPDLPVTEPEGAPESPKVEQGESSEAPGLPVLGGYPLFYPPPMDDVGDPAGGQADSLPALGSIGEGEADQPGELPATATGEAEDSAPIPYSQFEQPQPVVPMNPMESDDIFSRTGWPAQPPRTAQTFWYF
jgi:hypothetical protein